MNSSQLFVYINTHIPLHTRHIIDLSLLLALIKNHILVHARCLINSSLLFVYIDFHFPVNDRRMMYPSLSVVYIKTHNSVYTRHLVDLTLIFVHTRAHITVNMKLNYLTDFSTLPTSCQRLNLLQGCLTWTILLMASITVHDLPNQVFLKDTRSADFTGLPADTIMT